MFKYDFKRHPGIIDKIQAIIFYPGVQALLLYRLSRYFYLKSRTYKNSFLRFLLANTARAIYRFNIWITGADISPISKIGKDVIIYHPVGIVIGETSKIGNNVKIMHGVTLGSIKPGQKGRRHPCIGHNVLLGAHCILLGDIQIGNNVKIGAGSVVTSSIPDNATVIGNPAKILP